MEQSLAATLANTWMKSFEHHIKSKKEIINKFPKKVLRTALTATVESTIEEKASNVKNVRIGFMQNAKILMINFTLK